MRKDELKAGSVLTTHCTIEPRNIQIFGELVGDLAAHHHPPRGERMMAHGLYVLSLVNRAGAAHNFLARKFSCEFLGSAYIGDKIEAKLDIKEVISAGTLGSIIQADYSVTNQDGVEILIGTVSGLATGA